LAVGPCAEACLAAFWVSIVSGRILRAPLSMAHGVKGELCMG
jgi:hypothetical protein